MAEIKIEQGHDLFYECPECGNEEIELGQNYCQICGATTLNPYRLV